MRVLILATYVLWMAGCATSSKVQPMGGVAPAMLPPEEAVCVAVPADGSFESRVYTGSGRIVATRIEQALQASGTRSTMLGSAETDPAMSCRSRGGRFLVLPTIRHWEDRASGWSGLPDRIEIEVILEDLTGAEPRRGFVYEAHSGFLYSAFLEWGNIPPHKHLDRKFDRSVATLVGR